MIWLPIVGNYCEINAYASILAYADLLNQRHKPARTYIPFTPNYSVPTELRIKDLENTHFDMRPDDQAIILDVSVPEAINRLVPDNQILELIDHHPGYEEYWHERIGNRAIIEPIGAVATSIFEWWGECWDYEKMSPAIAKLLLAAILDNTLNFNANITTDRDRNAAKTLATIAKIPLDVFTKWYFSTVSNTITTHLADSLLNDCKTVQNLHFAQLTLWNATKILQNPTIISAAMNSRHTDWITSIISISERKNYFIASSNRTIQPFMELLDLELKKSIYQSHDIYLRKEIIAKILAH